MEFPRPRFGSRFPGSSSRDPSRERARRRFLILTAAQIGMTLLMMGVVGILIWRVLTRFQ